MLDDLDTCNKIIITAMGICTSYFGYRIKRAENKIEESVNRKDVADLIDLKIEPIKVYQKEISNRLDRIDASLMKLLGVLIK